MPEDNWSPKGLRKLATSMWPQESVGIGGGLLIRLARFLGGDPVIPVSVTAPALTNAQLPDDVRAESATLQVTGNPCNYRMDGGTVLATDAVLQVGTFITLTGHPSIQSFRFAGTAAGASTLTGSYFD